jgi:putative tryptophan/tyrosine transport system substrate-binding protein
MLRREFMIGVGGAVAWPLSARAQQSGKVWRIGFVAGGARPIPFEAGPYIGFLQGMRQLGYVEGKDFVVEWRFAEGRYGLFTDFEWRVVPLEGLSHRRSDRRPDVRLGCVEDRIAARFLIVQGFAA